MKEFRGLPFSLQAPEAQDCTLLGPGLFSLKSRPACSAQLLLRAAGWRWSTSLPRRGSALRPVIKKQPPLNGDYTRDPNIKPPLNGDSTRDPTLKALRRMVFINHRSTFSNFPKGGAVACGPSLGFDTPHVDGPKMIPWPWTAPGKFRLHHTTTWGFPLHGTSR